MQDDITGMTSEQLEAMLKLSEAVAREAGKLLREAAENGDWSSVAVESRRDIKLDADQKSETYIVEQLFAASPYGILGEEGGRQGPQFDPEQDFYWVVDPLDGTVNYLQGIPLCCCSIALMRGQRPILGVIYNFNDDELFSGAISLGCKVNGSAVSVSEADRKQSAVLMTGLPAGGSFAAQDLADFGMELGRWRKVRMIGSAALSLAFVASGRADAYWERGIQLWDVAAGAALVCAAGGTVAFTSSNNFEKKKTESDMWKVDVTATNGEFEAMMLIDIA